MTIISVTWITYHPCWLINQIRLRVLSSTYVAINIKVFLVVSLQATAWKKDDKSHIYLASWWEINRPLHISFDVRDIKNLSFNFCTWWSVWVLMSAAGSLFWGCTIAFGCMTPSYGPCDPLVGLYCPFQSVLFSHLTPSMQRNPEGDVEKEKAEEKKNQINVCYSRN